MKKALGRLKRQARVVLESMTEPRFSEVRKHTRGMLTPRQYRAIYDRVRNSEDLDVVDIGSAGGGTPITHALAKKDAGHRSATIAIEKCEGGSRAEYGGYSDNREFLEGNFSRFGVADRIRLFPHYLTYENAADLFELIKTDKIAGFMHDADGRIDRDFQLFGPRLADRNFVIIDDVTKNVKFRPISAEYPFGGCKNIITWRLLEYLKNKDLFVEDRRLGPIVIGHVPVGADFEAIEPSECEFIIDGVMAEHASAMAARD